MHDHTITLEEAAKRLGSTTLNTLMHIKRGKLKATEIDGAWQVDEHSLEQLLSAADGRTSPSVCAKKHGCGGCGGKNT